MMTSEKLKEWEVRGEVKKSEIQYSLKTNKKEKYHKAKKTSKMKTNCEL
jgi:hypothetical protein